MVWKNIVHNNNRKELCSFFDVFDNSIKIYIQDVVGRLSLIGLDCNQTPRSMGYINNIRKRLREGLLTQFIKCCIQIVYTWGVCGQEVANFLQSLNHRLHLII